MSLLAAGWLWISTALAAPVDVNTATVQELQELPGVGPTRAQAIVDHRAAHGPFDDLDDLDDVPGIGPATLANLGPLVTLAPADAPPPARAPDAVDINSATQDELQGLPGIGPAKAQVIVSDRADNGLYQSCDDLTRIHGIGPATVATFGDRCTAISP